MVSTTIFFRFEKHINHVLHVFHMRQRNILNDNEWTGWLRIMKSAFGQGTLGEMWESKIEMEKWFDPAFQKFVNRELASRK
jgi:hypothetical protein